MRAAYRVLVWLLLVAASPRTALADEPASQLRDLGPSAREVVRMALDAAKAGSPARVEALMRRARLSGLVPSLRISADRGLKQDLSATSTLDAQKQRESLGDDFSVQAALSFDLPRLVFASEEVRLLSVRRWLAQERQKLVRDVVSLYFERRRIMQAQVDPARDDDDFTLRLAEVEALLDAYTDGRFGRALADARAPAPRKAPSR